MARLIRIAVVVLGCVWLAASAALADKRVALVVGNSRYTNAGALTNPVRDAKAVAKALRDAGFAEVTEGYDLTKAQLDAALKRFGDSAKGADWALIYFAGHGISVGGEAYVLPIDVELAEPEHVDDEAISLPRIRAKAGGAKALRLVILDSCRNNPFAARMAALGGRRSVTRGLSRPSDPEGGELIAYSTRENDTADDGTSEHSPFTAAFLQHVAEPGLEVNFLFREIRSSVMSATRGRQDPAIYLSLGATKYYFTSDKAPDLNQPAPSTQSDAAALVWDRIKDSHNLTVFKAFREQFGKTNPTYDALAAEREAELKRQQTAVVVTPPLQKIDTSGTCDDGILVGVALGAKPCIKPGNRFRDCPTCPEMVVLPAGSFMMGRDEKVTITKPFAVGRTLVTRGEFRAFVKATGYKPDGGCDICKVLGSDSDRWDTDANASWLKPGFNQADNHPAVCLNWHDAEAYIAWLNERVPGKPYRLLSEAEAEYAARSVTSVSANPHHGSNIPDMRDLKPSDYMNCKVVFTAPVASSKPNAFGLYDVPGDVWTWTADCWNADFKAPGDGFAVTTGECGLHVVRGGSWDISPGRHGMSFTLADRRDAQGMRKSGVGFRLARTP